MASRAEAISFSNHYAPEHLIVNVEDAEAWLPELDNAGSVFLGRWAVGWRLGVGGWQLQRAVVVRPCRGEQQEGPRGGGGEGGGVGCITFK